MLRIALFLGTNLAILIVASITFRILGIDQYLMSSGMGNMQGMSGFSQNQVRMSGSSTRYLITFMMLDSPSYW